MRDASMYSNRLSRYQGQTGAGVFAADTVSRVLGVPIKYYLALDFAGFRQAIDAVGGIGLDVPRAFVARYPANDDPTIGAGPPAAASASASVVPSRISTAPGLLTAPRKLTRGAACLFSSLSETVTWGSTRS